MIKQLDKETSDVMSCQPIITTLERCIKELVDNSIDGEATFIKVSLENYGK
jgi:DNA mismatch repair ATPase MutL